MALQTMQSKLCLLCMAVALGGGLLTTTAAAQPAPTACDRLAAHPEDPDRIVPGVPTSAVDQLAAIAACEADLETDPGNARLRYQLARVYFYNGRTADAARTMERAAEGGHRQAQFVMGALISNGRPDASDDICDAEQWWERSAQAGRVAAQISYVRHVTKGLFDGCDLHASVADMESFLDRAAEQDRNYYVRLLIADLREDLADYTSKH
jgi:TPR repeat protein